MTEILKPKDLWERGISLQSAWEKLALPEEIAELEKIDAWRPDFEGGSPNSFLEGLGNFATGLGQIQRNSNLKRELRTRFEDRILDDLFNEDFYGFGYPVEPSPARMPRRIDPAFWDSANVDWNEGKAWLDNIAFNRIRIVDPAKYPLFDLSPKRPGPHSYKDQINWAIAYHTENDADFWQKTDSIRIRRMRISIKDHFEIDTNSVRGFDRKTFEAYLLIFKKAYFK